MYKCSQIFKMSTWKISGAAKQEQNVQTESKLDSQKQSSNKKTINNQQSTINTHRTKQSTIDTYQSPSNQWKISNQNSPCQTIKKTIMLSVSWPPPFTRKRWKSSWIWFIVASTFDLEPISSTHKNSEEVLSSFVSLVVLTKTIKSHRPKQLTNEERSFSWDVQTSLLVSPSVIFWFASDSVCQTIVFVKFNQNYSKYWDGNAVLGHRYYWW